LDNGTTWYTWDGSANTQISSLGNIGAEGALHTNFSDSMLDIGVVGNMTILLAFALYRPETGVPDNQSPILSSVNYKTIGVSYTDKFVSNSLTTDGVLDTRVSNNMYSIKTNNNKIIHFNTLL
jgi:hypothetical protein